MSFAGGSTEALFARLLRTENLNAITISALADMFGIRGASETTLSKVLKGKSLDPDTSMKLRSLLLAMESIRDAVLPLKLNWQNADEIKTWIDAYRQGKLRVSVEYDVLPEHQGHVIYYDGGVVSGFDNKNRPVVSRDESQALVFSSAKLEQIQNFLLHSGYQATARPTNREPNTSDSSAVLF